ncbi:MAG: hypothetical protein AB1440_06240 [Pseudomonadota bacterium]
MLDETIGRGFASNPFGAISISATAMAIEAMIVAVLATSFMVHLIAFDGANQRA